MSRTLYLATAAVHALLIIPGFAQETEPQAIDHGALLAKACAKMAVLPGIAFRTVEIQDNSMMRQIRGQLPGGGGGGDTEVDGKWCNGVLDANVNVDEDQVVRHGNRMIARTEDGAWKLRRTTLVSGGPIPFLFDPELFFEMIGRIPAAELSIAKVEPARYKDNDVLILGVTLDGELAGETQLAGLFPSTSSGGMMLRLGGLGGLGGQSDPTDGATVDMAFYVDPQSALIHRVRIKSYKKSQFGGRVMIQGGGGGGNEEEEEEEVKETDEQGNRIYKKGLPVRKIEADLSLTDFDITFQDHGKSFTPVLDDEARKLLRMGR